MKVRDCWVRRLSLMQLSCTGGGEALYELGVLDSGALIGLPAEDLVSSLETLERMAAEVDSHIEVVREVELEGTEVLVDGSGLSTPLHNDAPPEMPLLHEGEDFTAEALNNVPAAFNETARSIPLPPHSTHAAFPNGGPPVKKAGNSTRRTRSFERIPAGTRFCVEVLVKRNLEEDGEQEVAFIDFENFSTSF
jgi:hypothetical protein